MAVTSMSFYTGRGEGMYELQRFALIALPAKKYQPACPNIAAKIVSPPTSFAALAVFDGIRIYLCM